MKKISALLILSAIFFATVEPLWSLPDQCEYNDEFGCHHILTEDPDNSGYGWNATSCDGGQNYYAVYGAIGAWCS